MELKNNTKNNKRALQPLRVQRIDDVVCMVIESCILFDCGNTQIGYRLQKVQETKLSFISLEIRIPYFSEYLGIAKIGLAQLDDTFLPNPLTQKTAFNKRY